MVAKLVELFLCLCERA